MAVKYFEMFTGIGGFSKGIEQAYGASDKPICIGFSEIGKTPSAILKFIWPEVRNYGDASQIVCSDLPDFNFLCGGFPCQSWSIAGKRKGFEDARGTLFFEIARILSDKRPRHFLLENVKGLFSADGGKALAEILRILTELDYRVEVGIFNSKDFGVPQNRERCYFIGHFAGTGGCRGEILSLGNGDGEFTFNDAGERHNVAHTVTNGDKQRGSYDIAPSDISYAIDANYHKGCNDLTKGRRTVVNGSGRVTVGTLRTHKDGQGFREMQSNVSPTLNARARARQDGSGQPIVMIQNTEFYKPFCEAFSVCYNPNVCDGNSCPYTESAPPGWDWSDDEETWIEQSVAIPVLTPDRPTKRQNGRRMKEQGEASFTLTSQDQHGIFNGQRIRRLTPVECLRLQGFSDDHADFGINEKGDVYTISDTGKYQCAGNAVTVNVVDAIITKMLEVGCLE